MHIRSCIPSQVSPLWLQPGPLDATMQPEFVGLVAGFQQQGQAEAFLCDLSGGLLKQQAAWLVWVLLQGVQGLGSQRQVGCKSGAALRVCMCACLRVQLVPTACCTPSASWGAPSCGCLSISIDMQVPNVKKVAQALASTLKASLESVDGLCGTDFLEADRAIEAQGAADLKAALQDGAGAAGAGSNPAARPAALDSMLQIWQRRRHQLLPSVRSALRAALVQRLEEPPPSPAGTSPATAGAAVPGQQQQRGLPVVALHREVAVGGCGLCCNPRCAELERLLSGEPMRRCKACRVASYCG